ncbi:fibronectin type III domain-containing protein [Leifsonia aquatica]|uniref:fibronectin type III domain-containing protein n=1 Tax=Leifsonia aquatica TaxID=144185 RepID=UPI0037F5C014
MAAVGTGRSTLYLDISLSGQSGNSSLLHIRLWSQANAGWSGNSSTPIGSSVGVPGGTGATGNTTFNGTVVTWIEYDTWVGHDAAGNYSQYISAHLNATGTSTFGGPADLGQQVTLPRIPKVPDAPTAVRIDNIGPTNMTFVFSGNGNGGAGIDQWQVQYSTNASFTDGGTFQSTGSTPATGLVPGTLYYFRARGHNAVGWGGWSGTLSARTLAGAYVGDGTTWKPAEVVTGDGAAWKTALIYYGDGASWRTPS